jgi:hypothetical protein
MSLVVVVKLRTLEHCFFSRVAYFRALHVQREKYTSRGLQPGSLSRKLKDRPRTFRYERALDENECSI